MFRKIRTGLFFAVLLALGIVIAGVFPVFAAPPANDDYEFATEIIELPFSEVVDTSEATGSSNDPWWECYQVPLEATVWYKFTPTENVEVDVITEGSNYVTATSIYGYDDMIGGLMPFLCGGNSTATFNAYVGGTYYIMIGEMVDPGPYPEPPGDGYGGMLNFTLQIHEHQVQPPEVAFDWWSQGLTYTFYNNSWDPEGYGIETALWDFGDGGIGSDLFWVDHTYSEEGVYDVTLIVTTYDGRTATLTQQVEVFIPQPEADFYYEPYDPSIFDVIQFYDFSYDPAYIGFESIFWDFGDGATSTNWSPYHRYDSDGTFVVTLTVTTSDGRSGTTSRDVVVSTHDVAIRKFKVPKSAKVGQTRQLVVGISNVLKPETVEVRLYKSTNNPWWEEWEYVGSLIQYVPIRPANRTTDFEFTYTFTVEDGEIGKLNFKAEAYIQNANDALTGDNQVISLPVQVIP